MLKGALIDKTMCLMCELFIWPLMGINKGIYCHMPGRVGSPAKTTSDQPEDKDCRGWTDLSFFSTNLWGLSRGPTQWAGRPTRAHMGFMQGGRGPSRTYPGSFEQFYSLSRELRRHFKAPQEALRPTWGLSRDLHLGPMQ